MWVRFSSVQLLSRVWLFVGKDSWESLGLQGDPSSPSWRRSVPGVHWKDWCWSWNSSTLATSCEALTHWKRPWCWEGLGTGGEGDSRGWDGWMASLTRWSWVWVNSVSWWWTGRPGVLWVRLVRAKQAAKLLFICQPGRVLTMNWVFRHFHLGISRLQIIEKWMSFVEATQSMVLSYGSSNWLINQPTANYCLKINF